MKHTAPVVIGAGRDRTTRGGRHAPPPPGRGTVGPLRTPGSVSVKGTLTIPVAGPDGSLPWSVARSRLDRHSTCEYSRDTAPGAYVSRENFGKSFGHPTTRIVGTRHLLRCPSLSPWTSLRSGPDPLGHDHEKGNLGVKVKTSVLSVGSTQTRNTTIHQTLGPFSWTLSRTGFPSRGSSSRPRYLAHGSRGAGQN